jgi:hypothetical protein
VTGSEDPLTPEQEEVRRLLAEARHTGPTPPDVVARLDRVLDDLAEEPDRTAPVVDLARRRRRVASLLVAAAAVVAVGVGVSQVVFPQPASEDSVAGSSASAPEAAGEDRDGVQSKVPGNGVASDAPAPTSADESKLEPFLLRRSRLARDLTDARVEGFAAQSQAYSARRSAANRAVGAACRVDEWGPGRFVPVSYGGTPAVVVFRRPLGDTQLADVFLCGSREPVRSVTLPAP